MTIEQFVRIVAEQKEELLYCCPIKLFKPGRKNQGWHLLQESALFGYFAFATKQTTMSKSNHFSGQPLYSLVIS